MDTDDWFESEKLHQAVQDENIGLIKELVAGGFDVNLFDDLDWTPLHYAVKAENFEIVKYLLNSGANVNAQNLENIGETPLSNVGGTCSLRMAKLLVSNGANVHAEGWMRLTAIDRAKKRKKPEGVDVYEYLVGVSKRHHG